VRAYTKSRAGKPGGAVVEKTALITHGTDAASREEERREHGLR
jgi:hypothetical protein